MLEIVSDKPQTLKEFTENNCAQASFFWTALLKNKDVKVNGKRVSKDVRLYKGDVVCYYLTEKQAQKPAFFTVYEDENVLVVDKESGVNSEAVFSALSRERECYFIHRLDRNTKGLLVFALNRASETELLRAFKHRCIEKRYHALCFGALPKLADTLTAYLKKDAQKSLVKIFDAPVNGAEEIITEYKVLESFGETTLAEITLHTGKTHQIRAHLSHVGCPIVGDMKYGDADRNKALSRARQCLVAKRLRFETSGVLAYLSGKEFISKYTATLDNE